MIVVSHPTGNAFVRALLAALCERGMLQGFYSTLAWHRDDPLGRILPPRVRAALERRAFEVPRARLRRFPAREAARLLAGGLRLRGLTRHETGWASVDAVYQRLDRRVAHELAGLQKSGASSVYCYEDCALETFEAAARLGMRCFYDLPIAHWKFARRLLEEEAARWPEWEPTLVGTRDSTAKCARKDREIEGADVIVAPSRFVRDSLAQSLGGESLGGKKCLVAEFGSPPVLFSPEMEEEQRRRDEAGGPLRVLFAGSMSQRKGLADLFAAVKMLRGSSGSASVELVVMGSPLAPLEFYRKYLEEFRWEPPRAHAEVLELMRSCDVLALPSIVEGRALVQQEAMACGLPLLVTANAGGEDLIEEERTGFLVPIRSPERIAQKLRWLVQNRASLFEMRRRAREKAALYTWERYANAIADEIAQQ